MKVTIDTDTNKIVQETDGERLEIALYSKQGFELLSQLWLKVGWNEKYPYCFSWMGRPIIQLPEDMIRIQEVIYSVRPDVIIETGVAHGGSLIYYASICKAMEKGRVVGIDVEIRSAQSKSDRSPRTVSLHHTQSRVARPPPQLWTACVHWSSRQKPCSSFSIQTIPSSMYPTNSRRTAILSRRDPTLSRPMAA